MGRKGHKYGGWFNLGLTVAGHKLHADPGSKRNQAERGIRGTTLFLEKKLNKNRVSFVYCVTRLSQADDFLEDILNLEAGLEAADRNRITMDSTGIHHQIIPTEVFYF